MRKAQITLFVIIGMLILILIGFLIFIRQKATQTQVQSTVDAVLNEFIEKNALKQYVQNCLDTLSNDGAMLLAHQGGVLYQDQKGLTPHEPSQRGVAYLPYTYEGENYDVTYAIHDVEFHPCPQLVEQPPGYPVPGKNVTELTVNKYLDKCQFYDRFSGYYGVNTLPKLCDPQGPNKIGVTQSKTLYKSCEPGSYGSKSENTLQYQLQNYIQNHLPLCANFSVFEDAYGNRVEVLDKPTVTLIWGDTDFSTHTSYPFKVHLQGKEPVVKYIEFTNENKLRLKKLYYYANELLTHETQDLFYNIERDHQKANFYEESFTMEKVENPCNPCPYTPAAFDRLYVVRDERSKVLSKALTFLLPIKNRRPFLDVIPRKFAEPYNTKSFSKKVNVSGAASSEPSSPKNGVYPVDFAAYNGSKILVEAQGYDPDDDPLTYTYSAWKETTNSQVLNTACFDETKPIPFTAGVYRFYNENPNFCTKHVLSNLGLWSASPEYQMTQQKVGYTVTNEDIGLHLLNVSVTDPAGLMDYQEVAILVIPEEYRNLTGSIP
ncbi:MAG: hypothetical protein AABX70_06770 [Nanoarchaeota archaeon]